jgi:hypothetical protein
MSDTQVLTSENSAEFYARKLNLSPANAPAEAVAKTEPVVEKPSGEDATDSTELSHEAEDQHKPKNAEKIEKRIAKAIYEREQARQEAVDAKARTAVAEQKAVELEARLNPPKAVDSDAKPKPDQFTDAFEYAESLAEWSAENALKARDRQESEKQQKAEREKVVESWQSKLASTKAELPDYDAMIASSDVSVSDQVREAILESDIGPALLYHLAENPDVAAALASKSTASALRELGKIEARLSTDKPAAKAVESAPKLSSAPAPISPIRGASASVDTPLDSKGEFHGTYAQWKAARLSGKIK